MIVIFNRLSKYKHIIINQKIGNNMNTISQNDAIKGAFFGAIVADALCLGSHYEYDAKKIYKAYGEKPIERFMSPGEMMGGETHGIGWGQRNYHPGKKAEVVRIMGIIIFWF